MMLPQLRLALSFLLIGYVQNSVIRNGNEPAQSLYDSNDQVAVLTNENFYQSIYEQPYASNVEFYNSFCGFCRNFAPIYKKFAEDIVGWRDTIQVAAIDCANDANNDICRDMEIMRYPTLRYFPPFYQKETNHLGIEIDHLPQEVGEPYLFKLMANTTNVPNHWPNLNPINADSTEELFKELPSDVEYVFIVNESNNQSITAQKVAIDLRKTKEIQVRRIESASIATKLGLGNHTAIYVGDKSNKSIDYLPQPTSLNRSTVRATIEQYLQSKGLRISQADEQQLPEPDKNQLSSSVSGIPADSMINEKDLAIIEHVKSNPDVIFQADLETALKYSIFHELVKYNKMNEEQVMALKRYLSVLEKYSPLGDNGESFLADLNAFVGNKSELHGKRLSEKIRELEQKHQPVFSSSRYIGCRPSVNGRRGFSCGLWQLFHYLTVQATNSVRSTDPLEVLHAIHGFVKNFFGCTHCSQHFQEMAKRNGIFNVKTKDEAVLWLWTAHNEVNHRLAGDHTEDPVFPKIQYPANSICAQCYQQIIPFEGTTPGSHITMQWNFDEVLYFLRRIYSPFSLSRYGVDDESVLPEHMGSTYHSKLQGGTGGGGYSGAFSEMDIRMGVLLYAFCMLIIVVAVKLFLQRGYRKKIYTHDFLGKI